MTITRKEFLGSLFGVAALAACGGEDDDDGPDGGWCATRGTSVQIANNHGHVLTVSVADISAGVDKTYDITGTSSHPHMVTVTAANFFTLETSTTGRLMLTSTSDGGHTHAVTVQCA